MTISFLLASLSGRSRLPVHGFHWNLQSRAQRQFQDGHASGPVLAATRTRTSYDIWPLTTWTCLGIIGGWSGGLTLA